MSNNGNGVELNADYFRGVPLRLFVRRRDRFWQSAAAWASTRYVSFRNYI